MIFDATSAKYGAACCGKSQESNRQVLSVKREGAKKGYGSEVTRSYKAMLCGLIAE